LEVQAPELQEDANQKREPQPDAQRGRPSLSNPSCTFENFVVGKSNRLAQAASLAVAEMPGKAYNPLFIWSGAGLGKTHLMQAIARHVLEREPRLKVFYLAAERFVNEFVQALADERSAQFRERFRSADILLIDDIQFLAGKRGSQEEFFHTFNALLDSNKQVVLSADRAPSELENFYDRLSERFSGGLVVDIQSPDENMRVEILKKKAGLLECDLPEDVIHFLVRSIPSSIRELQGAVNRLVATSEVLDEPITIERASDWLKNGLRIHTGLLSVEDVNAAVAEDFRISSMALSSPNGEGGLAQARQIAMYLCRELTDASFRQIARSFNLKNHVRVIRAVKRISKQIAEVPELAATVKRVKDRLGR
ncbi:MAG: chromosomal replication initiator protein DnaA, partial [Fretibacterium sp.]|nr:chromosomal replication initiator protein DnaA [Fretibacterium sp.]